MNRILMSAVAVACLVAPAQSAVQAATLAEAIMGPHRSPENKARDTYRNPAATLTFFGIQPTMTVAEISPAGGWYTEILAPWLDGSGQYIGAGTDPAASEKAAASVAAFEAKVKAYAPNAKMGAFGKGVYDKIAPAGTVDAVLTFRNVHNWHMGGFGLEAFKAFYAALKPGGTLGVVDHRLPEDRPDADMNKTGYMKVSAIKAMAEAAGFEFVASSEVNANPKDTKDYPGGVWTLPPTLAKKDEDRAKFLAIGESDRFTLKFVKPAAASTAGR
ncbi:MAG: class I SAM-dependent methyltransferase [Polymorphobacter sp.]|uniref:class I SAM-dependent methyltransferase n=1 Tax=Polymorphobacter sp. TaxID=1909290 RepID=UPI003A86CBBA